MNQYETVKFLLNQDFTFKIENSSSAVEYIATLGDDTHGFTVSWYEYLSGPGGLHIRHVSGIVRHIISTYSSEEKAQALEMLKDWLFDYNKELLGATSAQEETA